MTSNRCLLVVDDNAINLSLIDYLLCSAGYSVRTAENGKAALDLLAGGLQVEAVLCDIQMPEMDGIELARRLRRDEALAGIPLIAVSALAMVGDRDRIMEAGFDGYLSKPIEPSSFVESLTHMLPGLRPANSAPERAQLPPMSAPATAGVTILALDDVPANLELKRHLLVPLGYRVLTAESVAEALRLVRAEHPDLIISDVGMREGSGFDFIEAVKADESLRRIPFLFLSATHWDEGSRARAIQLGAECYLKRPIDADLLLAEIRRCLQPLARLSTPRY